MKDFYSDLWLLKNDFIKFEIPLKEIELIKKRVIKDLELSDAFKLNDKAEGIEYFERSILKACPFLFFKKYTKINTQNTQSEKSFEAECILIENQLYNIAVINFGEMPITRNLDCKLNTLLFIKRDRRVYYFAGIIDKKAIKNSEINFSELNFKNDLNTNTSEFTRML